MRLDFNLKGSWKHALNFDERDIDMVMEKAGPLSSLCNAKARIVGEIGEVCFYYEEGRNWYAPERMVKA